MNFFLRIVLIPHTRKQAKKAKSAAGRKRRLARALREADAALAKWEKEQAEEGGNPATSSFLPIASARRSMGYGVTKEDVAKVYEEYLKIIATKAKSAAAATTTSNDDGSRSERPVQTLGERFGVRSEDVSLNTLENELMEVTPVTSLSSSFSSSPKKDKTKNKVEDEKKKGDECLSI